MRSMLWRPWPAVMTTAYRSGPATALAEEAPEAVRADELARWLFDRSTPHAPSLDDLASVFGLAFDAPGSDGAPAVPPQRLALTLAVLRDAFPDDGAARRWLRTADDERGGARPLDLLLDGRVEELESLAVRRWNLGARDA